MSDVSRMEALLQALIDGETTDIVPNSRAEACLLNCIEGKGDEGLPEPKSELEAYLTALAVKLKEGGGGSGDSWYDTFWDNVQENGNRVEYLESFYGKSWNDTTFKPKYDIKPTYCSDCFHFSRITNLVSLLNDRGVVLDTSESVSCSRMFEDSTVTHVGVISCASVYNSIGFRYLFDGCSNLHTVDKVILPISTRQDKLKTCFISCSSLENLTLEGVIYRDADFKSSPLTATSAKNIISCLENYFGTENEFLYTISFSATTWEYLDAEGDTASSIGTSWREYIESLGWMYY